MKSIIERSLATLKWNFSCFSLKVPLVLSVFIFSVTSLKAYCVYNNTGHTVQIKVLGEKAFIAPWSGPEKDSPLSCWHYDRMGKSRTEMVTLQVHISSLQFNGTLAMPAGGYAKVEYHKEENGMINTIRVRSWDHNHKVIATVPHLSSPGNRSIKFLATADPQYLKGNVEEKNNIWRTAFNVMTNLANKVKGDISHRGVIVAGDLTGWSRPVEFREYEKPFKGINRFLYDGLGNHDFEDGNCCAGISGLRTPFLHDDCICPEEIAKAIGDRKRTTPLTGRSGPNYSWDWHDVHFVQLNLYPGNGTKGEFNTYNSLNFLKEDLRKNVGQSGRPIVLTHHYGMEGFSRGCSPTEPNTDVDGCLSGGGIWWTQNERKAYWNAVADYNVTLIITGHLHSSGGNQWWQTKWKRPAGLNNGPSEIQTITAGGAKDGGYYMNFSISNNSIIAKRYQNGNHMIGYDVTIPITAPGEKPSRFQENFNPEGIYTIKNSHGGRALCTLHNSKDPKNKGNQEPIIQYSYYGDATQKWKIESVGNGLYSIKNTHGGRALCTLHNSKDPKNKGNQEPIIQYDYYGDATQKWKIEPIGNGMFSIKNAHGDRALCTLHNSNDPKNKGNQEPIIQYDYYGDATQKWIIEEVFDPNAVYAIKNTHGGRALSTLHNSKDPKGKGNQEPIIQYDYYGDATQKWKIEPVENGLYSIKNTHGGRALSTLHNSKDPKNKGNQEPIIQYDYYGDATQKWKIESIGNGMFSIKNAHGYRALCTLHNSKDPANKGNQEPIIQYDYYGDATQKWIIEKVN